MKKIIGNPMRLSELTKPEELSKFRDDYNKSKSKQVRRKLSDYMKSYGFKKLGSGAFGIVYSHEKYPDSVFKVFQKDNAFTRWIEVSRMMASDNPFFPRFKSGPIKVVGDIYMVRMEKLSFKSEGEQVKISAMLRGYFNLMEKAIKFGIGNQDKVNQYYEENYPQYYDFLMEDSFQEIFYEIIETVDWVSGKLDLHSGNFMWRGEQLVFTDPVAKGR